MAQPSTLEGTAIIFEPLKLNPVYPIKVTLKLNCKCIFTSTSLFLGRGKAILLAWKILDHDSPMYADRGTLLLSQ